MANQLYAKGRERFLLKQLDWVNDTIRACLVDNTYSFSESHEYLSSVAPTARIMSVTIPNRTGTDGYALGDPVEFVGVVVVNPVTQVVFYRDTGDAATSPLIAYYDTVADFPLTQSGKYTLHPDAVLGGFFRL